MDGYYALMLVATALVLMMTAPALALFYGGMTRSKSVLNMMMMSYVALGDRRHRLRALGLVDGLGRRRRRQRIGKLIANPFDHVRRSTASRTDSYICVMFQLTFAVITAALISRCDRRPGQARRPGWCSCRCGSRSATSRSPTRSGAAAGSSASHFGAQDYAGGTVVHINAGVAGLVLALIIGKRIGFGKEPMRPHNLTSP